MASDFSGAGGVAVAGGVDALRYALATLGAGVRRVHHDELQEGAREELNEDLRAVFGDGEELKGALEEAFEQSLQTLVVGLKQAWLLMETGGEHDHCEAFGEQVRGPFVSEAGLEGRLFIDFLDSFFLDFDTAREAASGIMGLADADGAALFTQLVDAGAATLPAAEQAARATEAFHRGFIDAGLEVEHPVVRFGCWRDLLADGLHWHFTDIVRGHPAWSRYLDPVESEALDREEGRAIATRDQEGRERLGVTRELVGRLENYKRSMGEILPNREWLFDLADRLEEGDENVESDLLKGRQIAASDLPKIVAAATAKIHERMGTSTIGRLSDVLAQPQAMHIDVLRKARRDFRRSHWGAGQDYGEAALQLAGALLPLSGPRAAERYYREAAAFGADAAVTQYGLYLVHLATGELPLALDHLKSAASLSPERFAPFDLARYVPKAIIGAGGGGPVFLCDRPEGAQDGDVECVVKTLWDRVSVVDPRPGLKPLATIARAGLPGFARLLHLGVHLKECPYVVTVNVEGDDLERFREMRGGTSPGSVVSMVGAQAARTVRDLHAQGLLHGNLKPGNVRVGAGEEGMSVTLTDPSVPNLLLAAPERVQGVRRLLAWSRTGRQIAEAFASYTAPEVVRGGLAASSPAADVFSLGAVLYKLAVGAAPRPPEPGALPASVRDLIMRCLQKDPAARPGMAEVADALEAAQQVQDEPPVARHQRSAPPAPPPPAATTSAADPFAAPADPFAADPFGGGQVAPDPFAADPFAAPGGGQAFAPGGSPYPGAGADPFAPAANDPFAPAANDDPFAPAADDPFAAPSGALDPFAMPAGADPFAAPAGGDPFGAPGGDPFATPAGADPFGAPGGDPFAAPGGDPFGAPGGDPFAAPAGADPFGAPAGGDPFAAPGGFGAPGADPFGAPAGGDPFAAPGGFGAPGADPFAPGGFGGADPFGAPAADPFGAPGGFADPFAAAPGFATGSADPFAAAPQGLDAEEEEALDPAEALAMLASLMGPSSGAPKKPAPAKKAPVKKAPARKGPPPQTKGKGPAPAAAPAQDPFAPLGPDPFAAPAGGDPFAAPAGGDPFAAPAGGDPFAAPAGGDPFAAPAGGDPFAAGAVDPFAAPAADPFAAASSGGMWLSEETEKPAVPPEVSAGGLWLSQDEDAPPQPPPAAPAPKAPPKKGPAQRAAAAAAAKAKPKKPADDEDEVSYGLVVSGLSLPSKKEAAVAIIVELLGIAADEAKDMCRNAVVHVIKKGTLEQVQAGEARFKEAKINARVSSKKKRS